MTEVISEADRAFMRRCLQLAERGSGKVAPNPLVGAVLVLRTEIAGDGFHERFGGAHAEVNAIEAARRKSVPLAETTLYVNLEPCAHYGKTPPCSDLIIAEGIRRVFIGCEDPYPQVSGRGLEKLRAAGVETYLGVLRQECMHLNRRFLTFHRARRAYVVLAFISPGCGAAGPALSRIRQWQTEESSFLTESGELVVNQPARARMDRSEPPAVLLERLYSEQIQSLLVSNQSGDFESYLQEHCWDELRILGTVPERLAKLPGKRCHSDIAPGVRLEVVYRCEAG